MFHRILLSFVAKLQLSLNPFIQDDINTYYYVNGVLQKTYAVENDPDVLRYNVTDNEKGKSAAQLFSDALWKVRAPLTESFTALGARCRLPTWTVTCAQVRNDLQVLGCAATLDKYDSYTVKVKFIQIFAIHEWHSVISKKIKNKKCDYLRVTSHRNIW